MMRAASCAVTLAALACATSDPPEPCPTEGIVQEALTKKCLPQSLDPVTDPERPDYGMVECVMVVAERGGSPACACDGVGREPASPEQIATAREMMDDTGQCPSTCCDELCFCLYPQLSGELLAACQSRPNDAEFDPLSPPLGWCYLEPALGFGEELSCPVTQQRDIRYFPDEPRQNILAALLCLGPPG